LLVIESDPLRWRDVAETVIAHADDLVRVGHFDRAWQLAEGVVDQGDTRDDRRPHARAALERFSRGSMMKHVATHLRSADDEGFARFQRLCVAMGTAVIAPLAEVLSTERDARSRRRLQDVLLAFGAQGRESVQKLMNAPNWEVRRTAAFLLRQFGGTEGLKELVPLLTDTEPLVQREAVQGLVMNGSDEASAILLRAVTTGSGRTRETLIAELLSIRDERVVPVFSYFLRHMDRRGIEKIYMSAVEALGTHGGPDAVDALKSALHRGTWWAPVRTRRLRAAAAAALRKIGSDPAIEALRAASTRGPRGVRSVARGELARLGG
jgi:HEAT repeat protein